MLVRLATAWIDPAGGVHGAGEHVDVDAVTLAELEEQGVVETMTEPDKENRNGPTGAEFDAESTENPPPDEDEDDRNGPTGGGGN